MADRFSPRSLCGVSRRLPFTALALAVAGLVGLVPSAPAGAAAALPAGYRVVATESLGPGMEHQTLRRDEPAQDVHVARLAPGMAGRLLPVLAGNGLSPAAGPEPTSAMCARVRCVAAVNGDFSDGAGRPVGAMVSAGELLTTPEAEHILLRVDGQGQATLRPGIDWSVGVTTGQRTVPVQAVNRPLAGEGIALYSRRWGPSTATDAATTEVILHLPGATGALPSGRSVTSLGPLRAGGDSPIPAGAVVLSGRGEGARAVAELALGGDRRPVLDVSTSGIVNAFGGSPQLLQDGALHFPVDNADSFTQGRHPRTAVGLTASGEILLVTADGRGAGAGLTLVEAAQLMSGLGAVDALNLDGGGSTTFVTGGTVRNTPSGGSERAVGSALTVLAGGPLSGLPGPPAAGTVDPLADLLAQVAEAVAALLQPPP